MTDLKPCPFCGNDGFVVGAEWYVVRCLECDAQTGRYNDIETAENEWNRRVEVKP